MSNKTLEPLGDVRYLGLDVSALSGEIDFAAVRAQAFAQAKELYDAYPRGEGC